MDNLFSKMPIDYTPCMNNSFIVAFSEKTGIKQYLVQTIEFPKFEMIETHKSFLGIKYDCKKIKQWQPLEIKIINEISHTIPHKIMNLIDSTDIIVDMLDPTGVSVSKWVLKNCVIKSMDFGNGKYGEKTVNLVSVTVQPETCVLEYC